MRENNKKLIIKEINKKLQIVNLTEKIIKN